jgi:hypothetical protein
MSIRPFENKALLTENSRGPESLSRRLRRQSLSASIRWRKGNEEDVMLHEVASVQRREDGSIDHDHYRGKASLLRSQAMFDLFWRGLAAIHLLPRNVFEGPRQEHSKKLRKHTCIWLTDVNPSRSVSLPDCRLNDQCWASASS